MLTGEESRDPLERGRRLYRHRDYHGAVEAFSDAISVSNGSILFMALDHRAASYEKLGLLQAGLRDSKQMIDLKPDFAKAYLRCGKVLQLKGEKDLALKIYERGLRKVKIGTDDDRTTLQLQFNKLRQSLDPGKCLDPFTYLPIELAELVMQNLQMRDRVICLAVSRGWKSLLESSPALWTTFDTRTTRRPISKHSLQMHLRRSKYMLDKVIINLAAHFDASKMAYLTRTCKALQHLEMHMINPVGDSLITALPLAQNLRTLFIAEDCVISPTVMFQALNVCRNTLERALFWGVRGRVNADDLWPMLESLKCLDLRAKMGYLYFSSLDVICRSIPNITELTLVNCSDWREARLDLRRLEQLEYLRLCSDINAYIPIVPPSLKHLDLGMSCKLTAMHIPDDEVFDLPLLESLNCDGTPDVPMSVIKRIAAKSIQAGHLKKLLIGRRLPRRDPMSGHEEGYPEYPASDSVTELSLSMVSMTEARFFDVLNLYPNVRKLDASENNMLTGVAVRDFVNRGITSLNLNKCPNISPDAVEWARSQGVYVEHKLHGSITTVRRFVDSAFATSAWP